MSTNDQQTGFLFGLNYWPRRKAMYWWKEFDAREVDEEFGQIADMNFQLVRICLLWEDFQPAPDTISEERLRDLGVVLDAAQRHGLRVMPALLVGNMSGVMWFPEWTLLDEPQQGTNLQIAGGKLTDRRVRDLFSDPLMLKAEALLFETVAQRYGAHPALHSWDLANEIDQAMHPVSYEAGWVWARYLANCLRVQDRQHPITYGAHAPSLNTYNGLAINDLAESMQFLSIHGYPIYSDVSRGPLDTDFVPYVTQLTATLGGKPTLMQEFGLCTAAPGEASHVIQDEFLGHMQPQFLASEEDGAQYYQTVLDKLWRIGALGAMAWCYADYAEDLWSRPPLDKAIRERTFGLVRADGTPKRLVEPLRRFGAQLKSGVRGQRPTATPLSLPMTVAEYYKDPAGNFKRLYEHYSAT